MSSLRKLLPFLRPFRLHMLIVIIGSGVITAMNLVNPWLVRELIQIIRTETGDTAVSRIVTLAIILTVVFFARSIFRYLYLYIAHVMAYSFVSNLRVALYNHLQRSEEHT